MFTCATIILMHLWGVLDNVQELKSRTHMETATYNVHSSLLFHIPDA
jgi:hypothetical protein